MTNKVIEELQSASKWFAEHGRNTNTAIIGICGRAVDEINRQRAEIERLTDRNDELICEVSDIAHINLEEYEKIKAKGVKEFADKLKGDCPDKLLVIHFDALDNLVKEMVGEQG